MGEVRIRFGIDRQGSEADETGPGRNRKRTEGMRVGGELNSEEQE